MRLRFLAFSFFALCSLVPFFAHAQELTAVSSTSSVATSTTVVPEPAPAAPLILQMADGRFYNPPSGLFAPSREELLALLSLPATSTATVVTQPPVVDVIPTSTPPVFVAVDDFPLKHAIDRAKAMLKQEIADEHPTSTVPIVLKTDTGPLSITLAVWNKTTDVVSLVHAKFQNKKLLIDSNERISLRAFNGANSTFAVKDPDAMVVGIHYPTLKQIGTKKKKKFEVYDVVYTPFSSALQTPEMIAYGKFVLDGYLKDAFQGLSNDGVRSRAFPDRLISEVVDPDLVKSIVAIEHLNKSALDERPQSALDSMYVTLASNPENAYAYAKSSASALGIAQFIPKTYAGLQKRAELKLISDFETAMRNPRNAVKAEVAYLDTVLAELPKTIRAGYFDHRTQVNEYLAASYNGGTVRVKNAIAQFGDDWALSGTQKVAVLQQKQSTLTHQIGSARYAVLHEEDDKKAMKLQKNLNALRAQLAVTKQEILTAKKKALKLETADYVLKFRAAMSVIHPEYAVATPPPATQG